MGKTASQEEAICVCFWGIHSYVWIFHCVRASASMPLLEGQLISFILLVLVMVLSQGPKAFPAFLTALFCRHTTPSCTIFCHSASFPWLSEVCARWQTSWCPWDGCLLQTHVSKCICYWLFGNMSVATSKQVRPEDLGTYKPCSGQRLVMRARLWLYRAQMQTCIIKQAQKLSQPILCPFRYSGKYLTRNHSLEVEVLIL